MPDIHTPFTEQEIWERFYQEGSFAKHLLTIYSCAVGINAKTILDIGIGSTTRTLLAAAQKTNGVVLSCDCDVERFSPLLKHQRDQWKLYLCASETFLNAVDGPVDFVVHDGAHDYYQVKMDLELILPKMRTFGLICIHDTQQSVLAHDMLAAIRDAAKGWSISMTNLPFSCGLAIIRVEKGAYPSITPAGTLLSDGSFDTEPVAWPTYFDSREVYGKADTSVKRWIRWKLRKLIKGY